MTIRELQQHPVTFWLLAAVAVIGFAYSIWSNAHNQPNRELSYAFHNKELLDLDKIGNINLTLQGTVFGAGKIYMSTLSIWNSGNQEIGDQDYGAPLQVQFDSGQAEPRIIYYGIKPDHLIGDLTTGFRFSRLFPKSGMKMVYFANTPSTNSTIVGSLIGGTPGTSGIVNRTIGRAEYQYLLGFLGILTLVLWIYFYRKNKSAKRFDRLTETFFPAIGLATVISYAIALPYAWYNNPPFP
jgi:hypothetical protein